MPRIHLPRLVEHTQVLLHFIVLADVNRLRWGCLGFKIFELGTQVDQVICWEGAHYGVLDQGV